MQNLRLHRGTLYPRFCRIHSSRSEKFFEVPNRSLSNPRPLVVFSPSSVITRYYSTDRDDHSTIEKLLNSQKVLLEQQAVLVSELSRQGKLIERLIDGVSNNLTEGEQQGGGIIMRPADHAGSMDVKNVKLQSLTPLTPVPGASHTPPQLLQSLRLPCHQPSPLPLLLPRIWLHNLWRLLRRRQICWNSEGGVPETRSTNGFSP